MINWYAYRCLLDFLLLCSNSFVDIVETRASDPSVVLDFVLKLEILMLHPESAHMMDWPAAIAKLGPSIVTP